MYTSPLLFKVCAQAWYKPITHSRTFVTFIWSLWLSLIKIKNDQCVILLLQLDTSLQPFGSSMLNQQKQNKPVISLTVWSFTVISPSLNKHKCNHTHPITLAFLLITEILLWLSLKKSKERKSQNVNSCIKPVHFCIYRVRDHLCTCYIPSHSG